MERIIDFMIDYPVTCLMGLLVITFLVGQWLIYRDNKPNPKFRVILDGNGKYIVQERKYNKLECGIRWTFINRFDKEALAIENMEWNYKEYEKGLKSKQVIKVIDVK